jgi:predicted MFS family arabinose efflux permease
MIGAVSTDCRPARPASLFVLFTAVLLAVFLWAERHVAHPMFDLSLLRVPTFTGGSIAAFAMNGSLYAMLLYFVIYLQDILGYSALQAGLRLAVISLAQLGTATLAGRLSDRVPARWPSSAGCAPPR